MGGPKQAQPSTTLPPGTALGRLALSQVWVWVAVLVPTGVLAALPLVSVDLAYVVRAGDLMIRTGSVLRTDELMAWTIGKPWLNQQWGAELIVAAAYRVGGWLGLAVLRGALQAGVVGLVFLGCRAAGADRRRAALLTLGSALVVSTGLQLRAELLVIVCFSATVWLLQTRAHRPRRAWWTVAVVALWANVHGSFVLGPLLIALAWLEEATSRRGSARSTLALAVAATLATVATPFGFGVWTYVREVATDPLISGAVQEWQRPTLGTLTGVLFFCSVAVVVVFLVVNRGKVPWQTWVRLAVFLLIGLTSLRSTVWWGLVVPVEIARLLHGTERDRPDPVSRLNTAVVALVALAAAAGFVRWLPYAGPEEPGRLLTHAPAGVTAAAANLLAPGEPFFNAQEWGSWFELALPANPVTTDSRFELIPVERWDQYLSISAGRTGWQGVLDDWGVRVAVVSREQQAPLIPQMRADPGWRLVYEDAEGLVFARS